MASVRKQSPSSSSRDTHNSLCMSLSYSAGTGDFHAGGGWWLHADHKHIDLTLAGNRGMMIKIPRTSPRYLTPTSQKKVHELQSSPQMLLLKTLLWKPFGSLGSLHISSSFSLLGTLQITLYFPSPQPDVSKLTLLYGRPVDPSLFSN